MKYTQKEIKAHLEATQKARAYNEKLLKKIDELSHLQAQVNKMQSHYMKLCLKANWPTKK